MSQTATPNGRKSPRKAEDAKSARLKAALKANLGRRKAQTKARAAGSDDPSDTEQCR
jgi:hypothetical protein